MKQVDFKRGHPNWLSCIIYVPMEDSFEIQEHTRHQTFQIRVFYGQIRNSIDQGITNQLLKGLL